MANSQPRSLTSGTIKLSQDIAKLLNDHQGKDVQFKVGSGNTFAQKNGEIIYDESSFTTLYAHSAILRCRSRYFAAMLDEENHWKEGSRGVIYKPNISFGTLQDVLYYIYTGNICTKNAENVIKLIAAAEEMALEELSIVCQTELVRTIKISFSDNGNDKNENGETSEMLAKEYLPINVIIRTYIIPALDLASSHSLSHLYQELLAILLPRMPLIIASPDAYITFVDGVSSETLVQIFASDNLIMTEKEAWDLALNWACYHTNLTKSIVEEHLSSFRNDYEDDDGEYTGEASFVPATQLKQLKAMLAPLILVIRFSLLEPEDYVNMINILNYFLPRSRSLELQRFFINLDYARLLDTPREKTEPKIPSKIVVESKMQKLLREYIFNADGITGCSSLSHLKFELLFRASEHGFLADTFHQRCNNKGPTLVVVRSDDGYIFGGVSFTHWNPNNTPTNNLNFLFALADGQHRRDSAIFNFSTYNNDIHFTGFLLPNSMRRSHTEYYNANPILLSGPSHLSSHGPFFGGSSGQFDLYIADRANVNQSSFSNLPHSYNGSGASKTALAGAEYFTVSEYEVFAISRK